MRSVRMTGMILLSMLLVLCSVSLAGGEAYPEEPASPAWRVYDPSLHWMYAQLTSRENVRFPHGMMRRPLEMWPCGTCPVSG